MRTYAASDLAVFLRQYQFIFFLIKRVLDHTTTVVVLGPIPKWQCLQYKHQPPMSENVKFSNIAMQT